MQIPEISREDDDDIDLLIEERNDFTIIGNPCKKIISTFEMSLKLKANLL